MNNAFRRVEHGEMQSPYGRYGEKVKYFKYICVVTGLPCTSGKRIIDNSNRTIIYDSVSCTHCNIPIIMKFDIHDFKKAVAERQKEWNDYNNICSECGNRKV